MMNLRWLWFDYVNPQLNLTRAQRRSVRRRALNIIHGAPSASAELQRLRKHYRGVWAAWLAPMIPASAIAVVLALRHLVPTAWGSVGLVACLLVQVVISYVAIAALNRVAWKPAVIIALRQQGFNVCLKCGYHLRGLPLTVTHCPECGMKRDNPLIE